jgi:hypothetical protein
MTAAVTRALREDVARTNSGDFELMSRHVDLGHWAP